MKIIMKGFEPETSVELKNEIRRPALRKSRIRLQPIMIDTRPFHAFTA